MRYLFMYHFPIRSSHSVLRLLSLLSFPAAARICAAAVSKHTSHVHLGTLQVLFIFRLLSDTSGNEQGEPMDGLIGGITLVASRGNL